MKGTTREIRREVFSPVSSIGDVFDHTEKAKEILHNCLRQLSAEAASLFLCENGNGANSTLRLSEAIDPRENQHLGKTIALGEGISGHVAASKQPLLVTDFAQEGRFVSRKRKHLVETFMSCPVLNGESVIAVVNLSGRRTVSPFSQEDLKNFRAILDGYVDVLNQMRHNFRIDGYHFQKKGDLKQLPLNREAQLQGLTIYNTGILKGLSQYVVIFDRQFDITYCSKGKEFSQLFGLGKHVDLSNLNVLDLPVDIDKADLKQKLEHLFLNGASFPLKDVMLKDYSHMRVVNMFFSPFSSIEGEPLGGLLLVDDNTENYEMRQRLIDAEKFSLIGSMVSMVSHEVNNPLDGAMRLINLSLAKIGVGDPVRDYLTEAQKGLQRIASLTGSLLGFSRKTMTIDAEVSALNMIIESATSIIKRKNEDKGISITMKLMPELPTVRANDFYQIINNLLSNACDAITSSDGKVEVEARADDDHLHIIIEDNGSGIPKHMQSRIFEAFWTTKEYGKGTGLGLAIVKKLVELYDGTIAVESTENIGTKVNLIFPRDRIMT